ncbi:MAG TPA: tetratricopeptide repeat protein, partial [Smithellaceae bacterium]|nr:tetratricopeptide repeat protein [Smithellaceae bacterium]
MKRPVQMVLPFFLLALLALPLCAGAEVKVIVAEGTYNMGDGETPVTAEEKAILAAKRAAAEEAGTYVESYSKVNNFVLTKDEVQVLAAGVMEVSVLDKKRTVVGDGFNFWVKIKARINPDSISSMARRVKDRDVVDEFNKVKEAYDRSQQQIDDLKKQVAAARDADKVKLEKQIAAEEKKFKANQWIEKGNDFVNRGDVEVAIGAYTRAIEIDPGSVLALKNRSWAKSEKGLYAEAVKDADRAIKLDGQSDGAYNNRGSAYRRLRLYEKAIEDFNQAILINPENAYYYN